LKKREDDLLLLISKLEAKKAELQNAELNESLAESQGNNAVMSNPSKIFLLFSPFGLFWTYQDTRQATFSLISDSILSANLDNVTELVSSISLILGRKTFST